jgi:hypothetical protein
MPIIKAPPKQPKSVTIQARVEEAIKNQLDCYAEFIGSTPSYVITEALKDLFRETRNSSLGRTNTRVMPTRMRPLCIMRDTDAPESQRRQMQGTTGGANTNLSNPVSSRSSCEQWPSNYNSKPQCSSSGTMPSRKSLRCGTSVLIKFVNFSKMNQVCL